MTLTQVTLIFVMLLFCSKIRVILLTLDILFTLPYEMSFRRKKYKVDVHPLKATSKYTVRIALKLEKKVVESCVLKKNLTKHMKRFHMMLDPKMIRHGC